MRCHAVQLFCQAQQFARVPPVRRLRWCSSAGSDTFRDGIEEEGSTPSDNRVRGLIGFSHAISGGVKKYGSQVRGVQGSWERGAHKFDIAATAVLKATGNRTVVIKQQLSALRDTANGSASPGAGAGAGAGAGVGAGAGAEFPRGSPTSEVAEPRGSPASRAGTPASVMQAMEGFATPKLAQQPTAAARVTEAGGTLLLNEDNGTDGVKGPLCVLLLRTLAVRCQCLTCNAGEMLCCVVLCRGAYTVADSPLSLRSCQRSLVFPGHEMCPQASGPR